jgi:hypothetical protein
MPGLAKFENVLLVNSSCSFWFSEGHGFSHAVYGAEKKRLLPLRDERKTY